MIQDRLNNIFQDNRFIAVGVTFLYSSKEYRVIEVLKKKDDLSIGSSFNTTNFEEVIARIPKNSPVVLSFSGAGIITKKVDNAPNYRSKLLFNANLEDFYWYQVIKEDKVYASVVRKIVIEEEIGVFEAKQVSIVDVSIGPFVATSFRPLVNDGSLLRTPDFDLHFKGNELTGFDKNEVDDSEGYYELGGEKITVKDVLPFATLINYLHPNSDIETDQEYLEGRKKEFRFKKAFNLVGAITLPVFLLSLLISYLLLGYYQDEYLKLEVELGEKNIAYEKQLLLENDKNNKEAILKESALNGDNFLSYYISEITKEVPVELSLNKLHIFPAQNKFKQGERVMFGNGLIELEGAASSNIAFTEWVKNLNKLSWLKSLEIVDFRKEGNTNSFKIKLTLKLDV